MSSGTKVFGIGLSRTGKTSLGQALRKLGIPTIKYPHDAVTQSELVSEPFHLSILDTYDGIVDISVAPFYAQLDQAYPPSKFVLTVRDRSAWLDSIEDHFHGLRDWWPRLDPQYRRFTEFIVERVYGGFQLDRSRFGDVYDAHVSAVTDYFRNRPGSLLVLNVAAGEGWRELCSFLDVREPDEAFPRVDVRGGGR